MQDCFALLGYGRMDVSHAGTSPLGSLPAYLASVEMMCYVKIITVRRSSLALFRAVIKYGEE